MVDDFAVTLLFDSVDFLLTRTSTGVLAGREVSFAILDGASSARGVAAATAHRSEDRCEFTAHVVI